jgi:ElaA protein
MIATYLASGIRRIRGNPREQEETSMPEITTVWRRFDELTAGELYELLRFRQSIFVVEQASAYPDLDGLDENAWHLSGRIEGKLAGYLRLLATADPAPLVRIGRVAISLPLRGRGFGRTLMQHALRLHRERYAAHSAVLSAQLHLVPFYRAFGFVATGRPYDECGVLHIDMTLRRNP